MKKIWMLFLVCLLLAGCRSKEFSYKEIMEQKEYIIIDVRTKEEFESGHVKDAINIPYDEINESTFLDKNKNIFVYFKSWVISSIAFETLKKLGYEVYDLGAFSSIDLTKE